MKKGNPVVKTGKTVICFHKTSSGKEQTAD